MNKILKLPANRVWRTYIGGRMLDELSGVQSPADGNFPEDWIASVTRALNVGRENEKSEGLSAVDIGGKIMLLKDLIEKYPMEVLGTSHYQKYGVEPTFLIKFLDSAIRLHVQCHPSIPFAKKYLHANYGKTEGYYILSTRSDVETPYIYMGFQHPPSMQALKRAVEEQDITFLESCFEKIPVKEGDAFYVPGGIPHAIGEGVFMIEIMEPTDFVVRLEFEKAGYVLPEKARFMDRGIDFALSMINTEAISRQEIREKYFMEPHVVFQSPSTTEYAIFDETVTSCFRLNKLETEAEYSFCKDGFFILIVTAGKGTIEATGEKYAASFGDRYFIPSATDSIKILPDEKMEFIIAMPPL